MRGEGKLPVLPFPRPAARRHPAPSAPQRADPDDLARAMAALGRALAREDLREAPVPERPAPREDSFTPVGAPRWRAGRNGDAPRLRPGQADGAEDGTTRPAPTDPLARRITAVHLPRFAIERWRRERERRAEALPEDLPVALAVEGAHGPVIHAANRAAEQAGVTAGARVVDMRALCPDLRVDYADIAGDRAALARLMLWARRWCPWTAVDGARGLVMDTTGSDHLWGGEAEMLRRMEEGLSSLGLSADLAVAPTHGAAWALSRLGGVREICLAERLADRMAPLSVRALRLEAGTVLLLQRLGLKTVGALAEVPRGALARRFARADLPENPLLRLDQMMGRLAEPLDAPDDPPRFAVQTALAEPVQDPVPHLPALAEALCEGLAAAGFGARRIVLTVYRTDGEIAGAEVATARPTRDPAHLLRLFEGKLDRLDPGFGFDLVTLGAAVAEDLRAVQTRLDGGAEDGAELAKLTDRLTARFGARAVRRARMRESHLPERRESWRPATGPAGRLPGTAPQPRPARLLDPPEEVRVLYAVPEGPPAQFVWRRVTHRVTRFAGPERVAPEWWTERPGTRLRDYYRVEDHTGRRFWIFRDGVLGDERGSDPLWFVHGVFA